MNGSGIRVESMVVKKGRLSRSNLLLRRPSEIATAGGAGALSMSRCFARQPGGLGDGSFL
jgi:hypothetical protein